jgi:hypothetical protein
MNHFVEFMNGYVGRLSRVIVGTALLGFAYLALAGTAQVIVAAVGALPVALGLLGRCLLEPFARAGPAGPL